VGAGAPRGARESGRRRSTRALALTKSCIVNKASPTRLPLLVAMTLGVAASQAAAQDDPDSPFVHAQYPAGLFPQAVAVADLDADGTADLVVANQFGSTVSVLLGVGGGGFAAHVQYGVGSQPRAVVVADLDGDGLPDLATADAGSASVSVLHNLGGGTFGALTLLPVGLQPRDLAAGDLDGDGLPDLVVANDSTATPLSRLMNLGPAGFSAPTNMGGGFRANAVRLADLDADGALDLLATDPTTERVLSWLGAGDGTFAPVTAWPVHMDPLGLAVADLDGDGALDVVSASPPTGVLSLLLGAGDGSFAVAVALPTGLMPQYVGTGDVDADGDADLLATHVNSSVVSLLLGDGAGGFAPPVDPVDLTAGMLPARLVVADASGDGVADVVVANQFSNTVSVFTSTAQVAPEPWTDLGGGVAGKLGVALLVGEGLPLPGGEVTLTVTSDKDNGPPAVLVVGMGAQSVPYKGGTLVPTEDLAMWLPLGTPTTFGWPEGMPPGSELYFQAWFQSNAREGVATGSNALRAVTQAP
jgi:hypothetical protein